MRLLPPVFFFYNPVWGTRLVDEYLLKRPLSFFGGRESSGFVIV
jgi:hypothetical protein